MVYSDLYKELKVGDPVMFTSSKQILFGLITKMDEETSKVTIKPMMKPYIQVRSLYTLKSTNVTLLKVKGINA